MVTKENPETFTQGQEPQIESSHAQTPLTPEYAANLFFSSYDHSQGRPLSQQIIFHTLHSLRPHWKMDDALKEQAAHIVTPKIQKYLSHSEHITDENGIDILPKDDSRVIIHPIFKRSDMSHDINNGFFGKGGLNGLQIALNSKSLPEDESLLVDDLVFWMLMDDFMYLGRPNGRPRQNVDPKTPKGDPWLSYICHYGLNLSNTGFPEFNLIYRMINTRIRSNRFFSDSNRETDARFAFVLETHNSRHPSQIIKW